MDGSGNEVNRYDYDPYGQMLNQQEQSGLNNPWKFASGYLDSSTGLYKFGVRYYDPSLGRWTQQDPVGGSLGDLNAANRYTYANDDPVNVVDPSGKDVIECALAIAAAFVAIGAGLAGIVLAIITAPATGPLGLVSAGLAAELGITVGFLTFLGGLVIAAEGVYHNVCGS